MAGPGFPRGGDANKLLSKMCTDECMRMREFGKVHCVISVSTYRCIEIHNPRVSAVHYPIREIFRSEDYNRVPGAVFSKGSNVFGCHPACEHLSLVYIH